MNRFGLILLVILAINFFKMAHRPFKLDVEDSFRYICDKTYSIALDITIIVMKLISDIGLALAIYSLFTKW